MTTETLPQFTCPKHGRVLFCPACLGERTRGISTKKKRRASRKNISIANNTFKRKQSKKKKGKR